MYITLVAKKSGNLLQLEIATQILQPQIFIITTFLRNDSKFNISATRKGGRFFVLSYIGSEYNLAEVLGGYYMFNGRRVSFKGNVAFEFLICFLISALAIVGLSFIFALIANSLEDSTGHLGIFSLVTLLMGGAIGGFITAKVKRDGALVFSAIVALAVVAIMLIICLITSGNLGGAFMNYACYMGVAIFSAFLGSREKKHRRHKR